MYKERVVSQRWKELRVACGREKDELYNKELGGK